MSDFLKKMEQAVLAREKKAAFFHNRVFGDAEKPGRYYPTDLFMVEAESGNLDVHHAPKQLPVIPAWVKDSKKGSENMEVEKSTEFRDLCR
jgi:hypothetical protein